MPYALPALLLDYFLYFSVMAFVGWVLETAYRSHREGRFVNAGFLSGPFVPIYGFGAVILALIGAGLRDAPPALAWAALLLSPTVLEYLASWMLERIFGLSLWDYRDQPLHLRGRICLRFSIYWAILAAVNVLVVQPAVFARVRVLGPYMSHFVAGALTLYFALDAWHSVQSVFNFKAFLAELRLLVEQGRAFLPSFDTDKAKTAPRSRLPAELRRLMKPLRSFPALRREFRPNLHAFPDWLRERLEARIGGRHG
jgi:uncharacterized membrane protein